MKEKKIFTEDKGMYYFTMILIGLHYLHSKQIIHRDLKPENILIDKLPGGVDILVIGDFGVSKSDLKKIKMTNTLSGLTTPAYMAPEMIANKLCTTKVDMWALGIMLYQFFSSQLPFEADSHYGMMKLISESEPAPLPSTVSPFIKEVIAKLLDKNPETRLDAQELLLKDEIRPYIQKIIT
jgi:serine/threonine protein kinase